MASIGFLQPVVSQIQNWNAANPHAAVDPQAALAVATHEGLSGGIGDGGHAFGPWQLNNAGGVITGMFPGASPEQINAWAWSPEGLSFAIRHIATVAGGLKGAPAVTNIVTRFERPANPSAEVANSLATLGVGGKALDALMPSLPAAPSATTQSLGATTAAPKAAQSSRQSLLLSLIGQGNSLFGLPSMSALLPKIP